ncbi:hypothetical protein GEMRC1_001548 [Eukaryota sp. GEM-RC1]
MNTVQDYWPTTFSWTQLGNAEHPMDENINESGCYSSSPPSDLTGTENFSFLSPQSLLQHFSCTCCGSVLQQAVETTSCNRLTCRECSFDLNYCPHCHLSLPSTKDNLPVRRIVDNLPVQCNHCSYTTSAGNMSSTSELVVGGGRLVPSVS